MSYVRALAYTRTYLEVVQRASLFRICFVRVDSVYKCHQSMVRVQKYPNGPLRAASSEEGSAAFGNGRREPLQVLLVWYDVRDTKSLSHGGREDFEDFRQVDWSIKAVPLLKSWQQQLERYTHIQSYTTFFRYLYCISHIPYIWVLYLML